MEHEAPHHKLKLWEVLLVVVLGVAVLAGAGMTAKYFMANKPTPQRKRPAETAPLVEVQPLVLSREQVTVSGQGTVLPAVEIILQARISGEVIATHPEFLEGGIVQAGETLIELDSADYELALVNRKAQVEAAQYEVVLEQGKQDVALREWDLLDLKAQASDSDRNLALRMPHERRAEANLKAAEALVDQATLELERTQIQTPFNAIIQSADVNIGDQATPQKNLARLVGTDAFWVQVSLPVDRLQWLGLSNALGTSPATATVETGAGAMHQGTVLKLLSDLEPKGRLARLLVEVKDPLILNHPAPLTNRLLLGDFVRVELGGRWLNDVFSVPRTALRDGAKLWLVDKDNRLRIQSVDALWKDENRVLLRGLAPKTRLVVSDLAAPVEGMQLRIKGEESPETQEKRAVSHEGKRPKRQGEKGNRQKRENTAGNRP